MLACSGSPIMLLPPVFSIICGLIAVGCCAARARGGAMGWGIVSLVFGVWYVPFLFELVTESALGSLFFGSGPPLGTVSIVRSIQLRRLDDRLMEGHCRGCGYDLTGNVSGRCPECGNSILPAT